MKTFLFIFGSFLFLSSCGENFLKLASEYGEYSTQQVRDIEEMRKQADRCDYEEDCFRESLSYFIKEFCGKEEYMKRGFISTNECERQYPFVFIKIWEQGKYASVDGLQAVEEYKEALARYKKERDKIDEAEEDYQVAKNEWRRAQKITNEEDYLEAEDDWEDAEKEYEDAWEDYREAREDYERAVKSYNEFFGF